MPTKQGGRALKNASTSDRCSFRRNTALPAASIPCSWKTRLAMSKPTVVISMVDGSFSSLHSTARAWHIDAVRGRPPHQISTTRLLAGMNRAAKCVSVLLLILGMSPSRAADLSAEQLRAILAASEPDKPANLSGRSLENLDLSNVDFKRANLSGTNLYGAKLDGADLSGANLSRAKLDLAWIMRANFTKANLSNASLFGPVVSSGLDTSPAEAPVFRGANFSGVRVIARLSRFDLRGANFTDAKMGADMKHQSMGLMRTDLSGADLAGANFTNADLGRAMMRFANLTGANLSGASLTGADLSGADLTGANLTGADLTEADLGSAVLANVHGLNAAKGMSLPQRH